jgi:superfamily II DNA or RNA helicase
MKKDFYFFLDTSEQYPLLYTANLKGKPTKVDYRSCSGSARSALMEFDLLLERQSRLLNWGLDDIVPDSGCMLSDPGDRMIGIAARAGLLHTGDAGPVTLAAGSSELLLSVSPGKERTFVLRPFLSALETGGDKLKAVSPGFILAGCTLFPCDGAGGRWMEFDSLRARTREEDLPLFPSMVLSRFPAIGIRREGFRLVRRAPRTAAPGLLFQEIDDYGYLHIRPVSGLPDYPPGFFEDEEIIQVVEIDEKEKELSIAEVVFPRSPLAEFRALVKKHVKSIRDLVVEQDGVFLFSPDFAGDFLGANMGAIASVFALYEAEKLSRYKIHCTTPAVRLQLNHGIDFLEGSATIVVNDISWSWVRFLEEYRKFGCISMPDESRLFPDPAAVRRIERLLRRIRRVPGNAITEDDEDENETAVRVSFFDLLLFNLEKEIQASPELRGRIESFYYGFNGIQEIDGDFSLAESSLRPYQKFGVQWMEHLGKHFIGGCLADDMGLGKTVQVIALLRRAYARGPGGPSLIIAPTSLVWNWESELKRFAPELPVHIHYGRGRKSGTIPAGENIIILTTYTTTRIDLEELGAVEFSYVILDESQHIKNLNAKRTRAILGLKAEKRLALSGTPVENNLSELYSLFRFLNPSFFGSKSEFARTYGNPIQQEQNPAALRELKTKIYPFMLRRLKQEVLKELPEKIEQILMVDLGREHLEVYHRRRAYLAARIKAAIAAEGIFKASFLILQALGELRRLACIPEDDGEYLKTSVKRKQLLEMVKELRENGHKCLIFTNFLAGVEMISRDLAEAGIASLTMTGATVNRRELVHQFQTDRDIGAFVMTLKTGGVGLNLTAADYVFIFDPWWNRAAESQAIDRTHRIGQKKPVFCYRIIARDTIEEKILQLQQKKAELTASLLSSDADAVKSLDEDDIRFLLEG